MQNALMISCSSSRLVHDVMKCKCLSLTATRSYYCQIWNVISSTRSKAVNSSTRSVLTQGQEHKQQDYYRLLLAYTASLHIQALGWHTVCLWLPCSMWLYLLNKAYSSWTWFPAYLTLHICVSRIKNKEKNYLSPDPYLAYVTKHFVQPVSRPSPCYIS